MSDPTYEALLLAVLEAPADDAPRLILADYLDERGESDRAEFIRVQLELERLSPVGRTAADMRIDGPVHALRQRERELFPTASGAYWDWLGGGDWPLSHFDAALPNWRRGFLAAVSCTLADWLAHGPDVVRRQPVERVEASGVRPWNADNRRWGWSKHPDDGANGVPWVLPAAVYDLLEAGEMMRQYSGHRKWWGSADRARTALSEAMLLYARREAFPCGACGGDGRYTPDDGWGAKDKCPACGGRGWKVGPKQPVG